MTPRRLLSPELPPRRGQRGFTHAELAIVLCLFIPVATTVTSLASRHQAVVAHNSEHSDALQSRARLLRTLSAALNAATRVEAAPAGFVVHHGGKSTTWQVQDGALIVRDARTRRFSGVDELRFEDTERLWSVRLLRGPAEERQEVLHVVSAKPMSRSDR